MIRLASRGIDRRELFGRAATGRDPHDSARTTPGQSIEVDEVVRPPTGAVKSHDVIDHNQRCAATQRRYHHLLAVGTGVYKPEPRTVGGKERALRPLGPEERGRPKLIALPNPQPIGPPVARTDVEQPLAVR